MCASCTVEIRPTNEASESEAARMAHWFCVNCWRDKDTDSTPAKYAYEREHHLVVQTDELAEEIDVAEKRVQEFECQHVLGVPEGQDDAFQQEHERLVSQYSNATEHHFMDIGIPHDNEYLSSVLHDLEETHALRRQQLREQRARLGRLHELDRQLADRDLCAGDRPLVRAALNDLCRFGKGDSDLRNLLGNATMQHAKNLTKCPR